MKKIQFKIINTTTLELQEAAVTGDIIDLNQLHEKDIDRTAIAKLYLKAENDVIKNEVEKALLKNKQALQSQLENDNRLILQKEAAEQRLKIENENKKVLEAANLEKQKQEIIIQNLKNDINSLKNEKELQISNKVLEIEKKLEAKTYELLKEKDNEISYKKQEIENLKNYSNSKSNKIVGEDLEKYCYAEYFKAFGNDILPDANLVKDNDSSEGQKGDFIFREKHPDPDSKEIVTSIMFEMKDERHDTIHNKKNSDFFNKLNRDRNLKKCDFAVLVTNLEKENPLYDQPYKVSDKLYPNMYVVRPSHFVFIIHYIRDISTKISNFKAKADNSVDISKFKEQLEKFNDLFKKKSDNAKKLSTDAVKKLDEAIKKLTATRDALLKLEDTLDASNSILENVTIKKLTYNNPTMKKMFTELENSKDL